MVTLPVISILIVFGVFFAIGIVAVVLVAVAHCKKSCKIFKKENTVASNAQIITLEPAKNSNSRNYVVLEDHLEDLVSSSTRLRQPIEEVLIRDHAEHFGLTLEFLPDDNTVIKVESTDFKVTRITKTKIVLGDRQKTVRENYQVHKGSLDGQPVSIHVISLRETAYGLAKQNVMRKDRSLSRLIAHPRYVRYHGTCFHPFKHEAYVITDFFAGASMQEIVHSVPIKEVMNLTEEEKIQASADLAEAVYFLHGHSPAVIHGSIGLSCSVVDGETHRGKLMSPEIRERIEEFLNFTSDGSSGNFLLMEPGFGPVQEKPPELLLATDFTVMSTEKTDIWSLGATILQFILDTSVWDVSSLVNKFSLRDSTLSIKKAMELKLDPSILKILLGANPKLQFLNDSLSYNSDDRPTATILSRRLNQLSTEIFRERKRVSFLRNPQSSSFLFPGRRAVTSPIQRNPDPLIRQQVEWNVKQESGYRKRALVVGIRNYLGKKFKSLSVTALNDIKDMTTVLQQGGYGLDNTYEDVRSNEILEDILNAYVETLNKEPEDVDLLIFFFAGKALQGLPKRLAKKQDLGIFMDRTGILHDLALVMGNESLFPVSKLQKILSDINPKVKRKLLILDCRISRPRGRFQHKDPFLNLENNHLGWKDCDWEVPPVAEETIDRIATMMTIYPRIDDGVTEVAMDSHPTKTNGFMTGCLLTVLKDGAQAPYIEELPKALNDQMTMACKTNKAFRGIQSTSEFIPLDADLWNVPILGQK